MSKKGKHNRMRLSSAPAFQLHSIERLIQSKQWDAAHEQLSTFLASHPNNGSALEMMLEVAQALMDVPQMWLAAWRLYQLRPRHPNYCFNLAMASAGNAMPFAALYYAEQYLARWPDTEEAQEIRNLQQEITTISDKIRQDDPVAKSHTIDDLRLLDESNALVSLMQYAEGRKASQRAAERIPDLAAPLNNIAFSYAMEGKIKEAVRAEQQALEKFPDNFHARCNLVQFLVRSGERARAAEIASVLKQEANSRFDDQMKLIESLSYLGDDAGLTQVYQTLHQDKKTWKVLPGMSKHQLAVGLARSGDVKEARKVWNDALKADSDLSIARENLRDLALPPGQQNGPWPFSIEYWVSRDWISQLLDIITRGDDLDEDVYQQRMKRALKDMHDLVAVMPLLLERGDPTGRRMALYVAGVIPVEGLKEFVLSQNGTDDDRMEASRYAIDHGLLPRGKPVSLWHAGEQQELLLLNYEIYEEPVASSIPDAAQDLLEQSVSAIHNRDYPTALRQAQAALALAPDTPTLMNQVAIGLLVTGQKDKANALTREIAERHPDYLFGRVGMARICAEDNQLEEAHRWLDPLLERPRLHVSEFRAICIAQIEIMEAEDKPEGASSWLNFWESIEPDSPQLAQMKDQIGWKQLARSIGTLASGGFGRRGKGRKRKNK